jgi:hypothetical protein
MGKLQINDVHDFGIETPTPAHFYHLRRQIRGYNLQAVIGKELTVVTPASADFKQ